MTTGRTRFADSSASEMLPDVARPWSERRSSASGRIQRVSSRSPEGLGMLVQADGGTDVVERATAFVEKRTPQFRLTEDV